MSTTFDRGVAMCYAVGNAGKPALVFEMQMGMIDRGAELGWISQVGVACHTVASWNATHMVAHVLSLVHAPRSTRTRRSAFLRR